MALSSCVTMKTVQEHENPQQAKRERQQELSRELQRMSKTIVSGGILFGVTSGTNKKQ